jgi:hypothetical protein
LLFLQNLRDSSVTSVLIPKGAFSLIAPRLNPKLPVGIVANVARKAETVSRPPIKVCYNRLTCLIACVQPAAPEEQP